MCLKTWKHVTVREAEEAEISVRSKFEDKSG